MMDFKIEMVDPATLVERDRNPNEMPQEEFELLVDAVRDLGELLQPPLVRLLEDETRQIVDGAHRVRAARAAGLESIPVVFVTTDEEQATAMQLGFNRLRGNVRSNRAAVELEELVKAGREDLFGLAGYTDEEAQRVIASLRVVENPDDILHDADMRPPPPMPAGSLTLEIDGFVDAKELRKVKRMLRKSGGGNLRHGLLKMLGEEVK